MFFFLLFLVGTVNFIDSIQESRSPQVPPVVMGVWDGNCEVDAQCWGLSQERDSSVTNGFSLALTVLDGVGSPEFLTSYRLCTP